MTIRYNSPVLPVAARPLCVLLAFCSAFYCDGFFALAQARSSKDRESQRSPRSDAAAPLATFQLSVLFRRATRAASTADHLQTLLRKRPSAPPSLSETASERPIGATSRSKSTVEWDFDGALPACWMSCLGHLRVYRGAALAACGEDESASEWPRDPFDQEVIRRLADGGRIRVWSTGVNANLSGTLGCTRRADGCQSTYAS